MSDYPSVSLLLPVFNEADHINDCLESLEAQEYAGRMDLLVADGGSTDGTLKLLGARTTSSLVVQVLDNPTRLQSHGVNLAAEASTADILIRVDAHSTYAPDYVTRSVEALLTSDAVAAGGPMRPEGRTPFGRAVAAAMTSRLAIGPGKFHHPDERREVDTVYLGAFRRDDFLAAGGYRSLPSGVAEDADLYFRWRSEGRSILLDPTIRSTYLPRQHPGALWRQFSRYGAGKADMLYANGRWPSWRPLAPLALVVALAGTFLLAAATGIRWPFWSLLALWVLALLVSARVARTPSARVLVFTAALIIHLSYGLGLLKGLLWRRKTK